MNRTLFFITLVAPVICLAQQPTTQPGIRYTRDYGGTWIDPNHVELRMVLSADVPPSQWQSVQRSLVHFSLPLAGTTERWRLQQYESGTARALQDADSAIGIKSRTQPEIARIYAELVGQLKRFVRSDAPMSPAQRASRLNEMTESFQSLESRMEVLKNLAAAQPDAPKRLAERLRQLQDMEQGIQMRLPALEARGQALQRGLAEQGERAEAARREDPIAAAMQKTIEIRERDLKQKQEMYKQGVISFTEVSASEASLAEAKARLAERMMTAGKTDLMTRLADELAMVSIDATDLQLQLAQIRAEIAANDPSKLTGKALDDLLKREPSLVPGPRGTPPLMKELEQQYSDLKVEWLKLVLDDVELTLTADVEPPPAAR